MPNIRNPRQFVWSVEEDARLSRLAARLRFANMADLLRRLVGVGMAAAEKDPLVLFRQQEGSE